MPELRELDDADIEAAIRETEMLARPAIVTRPNSRVVPPPPQVRMEVTVDGQEYLSLVNGKFFFHGVAGEITNAEFKRVIDIVLRACRRSLRDRATAIEETRI